MSNDMRMSLQNGLTIAGLIAACGISYSALLGMVKSNSKVNEKQDVRIEKLEYSSHQAELSRQKITSMFESIVRSNSRVEEWIANIEFDKYGDNDAKEE